MSTRDHIRLYVADDTPPDKLVTVAKYCLLRTGVDLDQAIAALHKARGTLYRRTQPRTAEDAEASHPLTPPILEAQWQALDAWTLAWPHLLSTVLSAAVLDPERIQKARTWTWTFPLSTDQWSRLRLTAGRLTQAAVGWLTGARPPEDPRPLRRFTFPPGTQDSYGQAARLGLTQQVAETPGGPYPPARPLTPTEQAAIQSAQRHAGNKLRTVFGSFNARIEARLLEAERQTVRTQTAQALTSRAGPNALASAMAREQGSWDRDWRRVARTELVDAFGEGAVAAMQARQPVGAPPVRVFKVPSVNACLHCQRIWLEDDGSPRLYLLDEVLNNPSNEGRPAAEWVAQSGSIHPNCTEGPLLEYSPIVEGTFAGMRQARAGQQP